MKNYESDVKLCPFKRELQVEYKSGTQKVMLDRFGKCVRERCMAYDPKTQQCARVMGGTK